MCLVQMQEFFGHTWKSLEYVHPRGRSFLLFVQHSDQIVVMADRGKGMPCLDELDPNT